MDLRLAVVWICVRTAALRAGSLDDGEAGEGLVNVGVLSVELLLGTGPRVVPSVELLGLDVGVAVGVEVMVVQTVTLGVSFVQSGVVLLSAAVRAAATLFELLP